MEPQEYERGEAVAFECDGGELVGKVTAVDSRRRERDVYGCGWTYDILVEGRQGPPLLFKHVPQFKVVGRVG